MILLLARSAPCDLVSLGDRIAECAGPVLGEMARKRVTANGYRTYTIDDQNVRTTVMVAPSTWPSNGACWVTKRDGSC